jgi:hypothetical protein
LHPQQHVALEQVCESLVAGQRAYFWTFFFKAAPRLANSLKIICKE